MLKPFFSKLMTTVLVGNVLLAAPLTSAANATEMTFNDPEVSYYISDPEAVDKHNKGTEKKALQSLTTDVDSTGNGVSIKEDKAINVINEINAIEIKPIVVKTTPEPKDGEAYIDYINTQSNFDIKESIAQAYSEVGTSRATGWNGEGECIMSVKRWIEAGGGNWGPGGTPVGNYTTATEIPLEDARPGDVVQYIYTSSPTSWATGVHTVLITGVNEDGTFKIVESNNPGGSGLVTKDDKWKPKPPEGFTATVYRF